MKEPTYKWGVTFEGKFFEEGSEEYKELMIKGLKSEYDGTLLGICAEAYKSDQEKQCHKKDK